MVVLAESRRDRKLLADLPGGGSFVLGGCNNEGTCGVNRVRFLFATTCSVSESVLHLTNDSLDAAMSSKDGWLIIPAEWRYIWIQKEPCRACKEPPFFHGRRNLSQWMRHYGDMTTEYFDLQVRGNRGEVNPVLKT
ncbi:hypothetical protein CDAR_248571 [Caerostris darwini]|uniref:Uncharacterized protein n=1 Tax=Caerostris darwini TaxID=1538125 RepID=A0AAV4VGI8_9ARAC|nr:hypothetical protein CDAR_248571 [Caerostris darwini]